MAHFSRVVLFVLIKEKKLLLEKRPIHGFLQHQYLIPGGAINQFEELEEALKREMREELGIVPTKFELLTNEDIPGLNNNILKPFVVTSWEGSVPKYILDKEDPFPLIWVDINKAINLLPTTPSYEIQNLLKKYT